MENNEFEQNIIDANSTPEGNDKLYGILSYIGILWILGLIIEPEKNHAYVKNHVNNNIWLLIFSLASCIIWVLYIGVLVFWVMGLIAACQGKTFTMPLIGDKLPTIVK